MRLKRDRGETIKIERLDCQKLQSKSGPGRYKRVFWTIDLKYEALIECVNGFSEDNFIGKFQFGEVYRGIFEENEVIVKVWKNNFDTVRPGDNEGRFYDEIRLHHYFTRHNFHPNLAKLAAFCNKGKQLAVVYHMQPKAIETLHNLIEKDTFTWSQRIKVALGLASLLEFMHSESQSPTRLPYLIRNIDAAHIMVDEDHEPVLFDLSMISGGILTDKRHLLDQYVDEGRGYVDPVCARPGEWSDKCDVFSYGVLLLALISKQLDKGTGYSSPLSEWMKKDYKFKKSATNFCKSQSSLVHQSLESGPKFSFSDAIKLSKLAMRCVQYDPRKRPSMKQVVRYLQKLHIVQHYGNSWEVNKILNGGIPYLQSDDCSGKESKRFLKWCRGQFSKFFPFNGQFDTDFRSSNHSWAGNNSLGGKDNAVKVFSYESLSVFTNRFSEENLIGNVQYGEVFRGKIEDKNVMVKIWKHTELYKVHWGDNESRFRDEMALLQHPKFLAHPNLVNLIGYCYEEEKFGVVYDVEPYHTVCNLAPRDHFTWLQRVKVGYEMACLLKYLHSPDPPYKPCIVRNLDAAHIILDKEYKPKLFDFGMCTGGIILDYRHQRDKYTRGTAGYMDPDTFLRQGVWFRTSDVYAYGCILLSLISKRITTVDDLRNDGVLVRDWAFEEYESQMSKEGSCSLVHSSLVEDGYFNHNDGVKLTKLALQCVNLEGLYRPTMKQVVKRFLKLHIVRNYAKELGIK